VYLQNICPTKPLHFGVPYEALFGYKSTFGHSKVFGYTIFSHTPKENMSKLDVKSMKCPFIGYCSKKKAYTFHNTITCEVFSTEDVIFHEFGEIE